MTAPWREWELRIVLQEIYRATQGLPFTRREIPDRINGSQLRAMAFRGYLRKVGWAPVSRSGSRVRVWQMTDQATELAAEART